MFKEQLITFLSFGLSHAQFWNLTIGEMEDIIKAENKKYKTKLEDEYRQSAMIASFVNKALAGKQFPKISELYPSIFGVESDSKLALDLYKSNMRAFVEEHNRRRHKKEVKP